MSLSLFLANSASGLLRSLDPEKAHRLTIKMLQSGLAPRSLLKVDPSLAIEVAGLSFPNPLGLAAGFDKNAEVADALLGLGFGFVEVGAVTPRPQAGNPRPRVFRLTRDRAIINRYGFNNEGLAIIAARLEARKARGGIVGVNLGANKDSADRVQDFVTLYERLAPLVSFCTINISSPNTPGLRMMQSGDQLHELLARLTPSRAKFTLAGTPCPLFVKIAPDLSDEDKADLAATVAQEKMDALIIANTTTSRASNLKSRWASEQGGLSGAPLFRPSTTLLKEFSVALGGRVPLIGVGGIGSAREAYVKILHGASLVQLYTGLVYEGPGLAQKIVRSLPDFLKADGFLSIKEAIGQAL